MKLFCCFVLIVFNAWLTNEQSSTYSRDRPTTDRQKERERGGGLVGSVLKCCLSYES